MQTDWQYRVGKGGGSLFSSAVDRVPVQIAKVLDMQGRTPGVGSPGYTCPMYRYHTDRGLGWDK